MNLNCTSATLRRTSGKVYTRILLSSYSERYFILFQNLPLT
jgi:hypothetical protein